jgi:hypothetical protein
MAALSLSLTASRRQRETWQPPLGPNLFVYKKRVPMCNGEHGLARPQHRAHHPAPRELLA